MRLSRLVRLVQAKKPFPELKRKTSTIDWICCSDPERKRSSSGEQVWMSWCMYDKDGKKGGMNRIVGRPKKNERGTPVLGPKPTSIVIDGKPVRKCPG